MAHENAVVLVNAGRAREAAQLLCGTIRAHPGFEPAIQTLLDICIPHRLLVELAGGLEEARAGGNADPQILETLVLVYLDLKRPRQARACLDDLLGAHPRKQRLGRLSLAAVWREIARQSNAGAPRSAVARRREGLDRSNDGSPSSQGASASDGEQALASGSSPSRRRSSMGAALPQGASVSRHEPTPRRVHARSTGAASKERKKTPAQKPPKPAASAKVLPSTVVPAAPPPPILTSIHPGPIGVEIVVEDSTLTARLDRGAVDGLNRYRLALEANRLSMVGNLDELLCLPHLHGVRHLWFQIETVRKVLRRFRGRALLCDEVGLGKTIETGMAIKEYRLRSLVRSVLVLVPPALVQQWKEEMESKFDLTFVTTSDPAYKADPDLFWREQRMVIASLALARSSRHRERVVTAKFDLVVVDEAHHLRNRATEAWKLVDRIKSPFLLLLTATPLQNNLEELHNLITLLKPGQLATRTSFLREFVSKEDPARPVNEEKLRLLVSEVMVRNTRALAGLRLPPRHARTWVLDPSPAEATLYERLSALVRARYRETAAPAVDVAEVGRDVTENGGLSRLTLYLLQSEAGSSPAALARTLERLEEARSEEDPLRTVLRAIRCDAEALTAYTKVEALISDLRSQNDQTLVFVSFRETLAYVAAGLRRAGLDPLLFHGGMTAAEKESAVDRFREGGPVLLTTEIGGEGRNLQFCRRLVNFDLPWNPMRIEQRIGRLHRIGQDREIEILNLCARGTVEDHLLEVLDRKINLFELVVGEVDMILGRLEDKREFPERVMEAWAGADTPEEVARNFEHLAEDLGKAKADYERIKTLDHALFGEDYEA